MQTKDYILIGNSFPLSLLRCPIRMMPESLSELQSAALGAEVLSFWGHANTLALGETFCGLPLLPETERPVIRLSEDFLPMLNGHVFRECWIVSPDYVTSFRPAVNEEVPAEKIAGWQILKITWEE